MINIKLEYDERYENQLNKSLIRNYLALKHVRYLQCSAKTPLRIVVKLLMKKYDIPSAYQVRTYLIYNGSIDFNLCLFSSNVFFRLNLDIWIKN